MRFTLVLVALALLAGLRLRLELPRLLLDDGPLGAIDLRLFQSLIRDWFAAVPIYATRRGATHPPATYVLLWPLYGWAPQDVLRVAWAVTTPIALAAAGALLAPVARLRGAPERLLAAVFLVASYPVAITLGNGQVAVLQLAALAGAIALLARRPPGWGRDALGAALFLFALAKPNVAAPFGWVLLFAMGGLRPFALAALGYGALTFWAVAVQTVPPDELLRAYLDQIGPGSRWRRSANLQWLLHALGAGRWSHAASFAVLGLHGVWTWRHRAADPWLLTAVAALVARLWAFHGIYDDVLLFFPLAVLIGRARATPAGSPSRRGAAALAAATAVALLIPATPLRSLEPLGYGLRLAQLALWLALLVALIRAAGPRCPARSAGIRSPAVHAPRPTARLLALALLVLLPTAARAQAYLQWDAGARAAGLAGAGAAEATDPAAVLYGPAGIVHLTGTRVRAEATAAVGDARFRAYGLSAFDAEPAIAVDPALFATHAISRDLVAGVAITSPWGFATEWDDPAAFVGRFRAVKSSLRTLQAAPVLAFGPRTGWSAALGVDVLYARFDLDRFEQDPALSALGGGGPIALARTEIDTDGTGVGWNAAVHWRPDERLDLGGQLRSGIEIDLGGLAQLTAVAPPELRAIRLPGATETIGERIADTYVDQSARTSLAFPRQVILGAAWRPVDQLRLLADVQWVGWGTVDTLGIAFRDTNLAGTMPLPLDDEWVVRLGSEIELLPAHVLRLGFAWQPSPVSAAGVSPLLPDAARASYAIGIGFPWNGLGIDVGYRLSVSDDREGVAFPAGVPDPDGVYESVEHRVGIGVARRL